MSVVVEAVSKRFQAEGAAAVDAVSFTAPEGGVTSLLGPSGSGKSTLLRMISGLEVPDSGTIRVRDRDITNVPVRERNVGFVFQGYSLFGHMTVADNVAFGLSVRSEPKAKTRARVQELLTLVQLDGYEKRLPHQLSGGQRQRVALARALATEPAVLLLDEPFGALDTRIRAELRRWLRELHDATHVTTLLVTHDQEEALELSDHLVVMEQGRVAQAGSPSELYDHPANPFVASFLGGASVLHGAVQDGRFVLGHLAIQAPGLRGSGPARAFIRPESVRVAQRLDGAGRIDRLTRVGGQAKVELALPDAQRLAAVLPWTEAERLAVGDAVSVDVETARVFAA
jgi:sulfate transport system ATP-binding protein